MCGRAAETLQHVLSWCSAVAQSKYLNRHNAALKILFFEMRKDHKLVDSVPSWNSPVTPKAVYESPDAQAYWDVPVYADHTCVEANRVDARFVDHKGKKVWAVEISCPWVENPGKKDEEKTIKDGPLRWELRKQYTGYNIDQCNIVIDVLYRKVVKET